MEISSCQTDSSNLAITPELKRIEIVKINKLLCIMCVVIEINKETNLNPKVVCCGGQTLQLLDSSGLYVPINNLQGYTRRYTYNQLQAKPDNGKHR